MLMLVLAAGLLASPAYDRCMAGIDNGGFVKSQMLECATKEMDRADAALNARYKTVMALLSPPRRAQLRASEQQWIDRRRAQCLAAMREQIPSPEINRMRCPLRETHARTAYLDTVR